MHNMIKIDYKENLYLNDQSKEEYQEYLLCQLKYNLEKWKLRYSMNEHMLSITGATNMLEAIIECIEEN